MLDSQLMFSEKQGPITASAASTNIINLGKDREVAFGNPIPMLIDIKEAFNNCTSVTFAVQTASDEAFTTPVTLVSATVLLADLKKGNRVPIVFMPAGNLGYVRLYYTVTGTAPTTGKVSAYLTDAIQQGHHNK